MKSICPFCGVGCGLELMAVNNIVVGVKPVPEHVVSRGHLCGKGSVAHEALTAWDRLYYPLKKVKGELERTSWEDSIKYTIESIKNIQKKYGKDSVAFYGGCQNSLEEVYLLQKLARALGTNNVDSCARVCHDPSAKALKEIVGVGAGSNSATEIPKAKVVVVAGESVTDSHPVLIQYFLEAKEKGKKIILIDPRNTRFASFADLHLKIKPRSDIFLFNAVANYLIQNNMIKPDFIAARTEGYEKYKENVSKYTLELAVEQTGLAEKDIIEFAKYISEDKVIFSWGLGLTESTGTKGIKSYLSLPLLTGNMGKEGAGVIVYRGQTNVQGSGDLIKPDVFPNGEMNEANSEALSRIWGFKPPVNKGSSIIDTFYGSKNIKALFIMGYNPVRSLPDRKKVKEFLGSLELLVVQDIFMTDTARYADIVLPAAAWAEKEGSVASLDRLVKWRFKAVDPPGMARPDYEILSDLAKAAGYNFNSNPKELFEELKTAAPLYSHLNIDDVMDYSKDSRYPNGELHLYGEKFSTKSGKAQFIPVDSEKHNDGLILVTGRTVTRYNSDEVINRVPGMQEYNPTLWINPSDAKNLGIENEDMVKLASKSGELDIIAKITDDVIPGVVFTYMHNPKINDIVSPEFDDETKTPKYKYTPVTVTK
ncbi:formate dehydrogenase subunit alpha [Ferroplasma acidiphilum]|uniref:Formate dehydrogenase subunit alpha n=1 Tax=Ferroplasma acidiphilum TaxID=74969 RepID=A0A7K4FM24_9ARCH|nr:formate dehydrogenase subunit alpha [Ferroplasma acidiphilum]NOL60100.1 formate dehydrogenase subunit alpha [Ferroplasma acidiphilum]WMT52436.1 MAG: formate dehydrogenase subunit alpha [Ferroplasma acidiphilum]